MKASILQFLLVTALEFLSGTNQSTAQRVMANLTWSKSSSRQALTFMNKAIVGQSTRQNPLIMRPFTCGKGGRGKFLKQKGAKEPSATCHHGIRRNRPECAGEGKSAKLYWLDRESARPTDWVRGTRYRCEICEDFKQTFARLATISSCESQSKSLTSADFKRPPKVLNRRTTLHRKTTMIRHCESIKVLMQHTVLPCPTQSTT
jgi:hypothetical protein